MFSDAGDDASRVPVGVAGGPRSYRSSGLVWAWWLASAWGLQRDAGVKGRRWCSDMGKYTIQRPRHFGEIQGVDEQARVPDLPAAAGAHEPPELLLIGPSLLRRLLLEGAERSKLTLRVDAGRRGVCLRGTQ